MRSWMYIIECRNGAYYVGKANNLHFRMDEHSGRIPSSRHSRYVKSKGFGRLVYFEAFSSEAEALAREHLLKHWHADRYGWGRSTPIRRYKEYLVGNFPAWKLKAFDETATDAQLTHRLSEGGGLGLVDFVAETPQIWWEQAGARASSVLIRRLMLVALLTLIAFAYLRQHEVRAGAAHGDSSAVRGSVHPRTHQNRGRANAQ